MKRIIFILYFFCSFTLAYAAILSTSVSRDDIAIGQTFNFTINAAGNETNLSSPDVAPLQKDFTILGRTKSQSLNIVNNKVTREDQWIITLIPKKAGELIIPSLSVGKDKTKALTINVATTQQVKTNGKQNVFIDTKLIPKKPYVDSEMIYQLRVYYDVGISSASIVPPESKNAIIKQLGQDQSYATKIKGKHFQVFQRNFAVFPQKAGKLEISPAVFRAQVVDKSSNIAYSGFYSLNTKPVQLIAPSVTIEVKPVPKNLDDTWWLPSSQVRLTEHWSNKQNQIEVGTPITRDITLSAVGVMASQLPPLTTSDGQTYNSYGGQSQMENTIIDGHVVGNETVKFVYIPTQKGQVILPAITVKWWNTHTDKLETATLPMRTFTVTPSSINKPVETTPTLNQTSSDKSEQTLPLTNKTNDWVYIALGLLLLWLATIFIWWFSKRSKTKTVETKPESKQEHDLSLKQACFNNNPQAAKIALLDWAREKLDSDSIRNLNDILQKIQDVALVEQIELLQQKLYHQLDMQWSGAQLWQCIKSFKAKKTKASKNKDSLPKLNPE